MDVCDITRTWRYIKSDPKMGYVWALSSVSLAVRLRKISRYLYHVTESVGGPLWHFVTCWRTTSLICSSHSQLICVLGNTINAYKILVRKPDSKRLLGRTLKWALKIGYEDVEWIKVVTVNVSRKTLNRGVC